MKSFHVQHLAFGIFAVASFVSFNGCARAQEAALAATPNGAGLQRVLLSPLDAGSPVTKGAWQMDDLSAAPAVAGIKPQFGATALTLGGRANRAGAKGDFTLSDAVPGAARSLGMFGFIWRPIPTWTKLGFRFMTRRARR